MISPQGPESSADRARQNRPCEEEGKRWRRILPAQLDLVFVLSFSLWTFHHNSDIYYNNSYQHTCLSTAWIEWNRAINLPLDRPGGNLWLCRPHFWQWLINWPKLDFTWTDNLIKLAAREHLTTIPQGNYTNTTATIELYRWPSWMVQSV